MYGSVTYESLSLQVKKVHKTSWNNSDIVVDREVLDQMKKIASSDVEKIMAIRRQK